MDQNNQNQGGVNSPQQPATPNPSPTLGISPSAQPTAPQMPTVEDIQKKLNEQLSEAMQAPAAPQGPGQDMAAAPPSPMSPSGISPSAQPPAPAPTPMPSEPVVPQVEPTARPEAAPTGTSVTLYTIENCPFCKAEKEYLAKEGMQFTEKRVDTNEADLKEMLELSDNFAGVPVTLIKTGDRQRVIKGFTQADFEQELVNLGLKQGTPMQPPTSPSGISATPQPAVAAPMATETPAGAMSPSGISATPQPTPAK